MPPEITEKSPARLRADTVNDKSVQIFAKILIDFCGRRGIRRRRENNYFMELPRRRGCDYRARNTDIVWNVTGDAMRRLTDRHMTEERNKIRKQLNLEWAVL